jgi:3-hydroxyisobutyrate dehydrogenase-like beta-hydroxyacid dehydrogenase
MAADIGFIGLGKMGGAIAGRLVSQGVPLEVYDTRAPAVEELKSRGAKGSRSVAELASRCETVFLSLPTPEIVREVAREVSAAPAGRVRTVIDVSTTGPRISAQIAAALGERGVALVDAPVSGGIAGATKGTLAVMVAGDPQVVSRCRALLDIVGKVFVVGERAGLGQTMKLCNNLLSATALAIASEAMVLGVKAGLDPRQMLEVINTGSGRNSATQDKFPRSVLPRTFDFGFGTGLMYKDVRLAMEEAERLGVQMWVAPAVRQMWLQACMELGPDSDFSAIVKCVERLAGVEVRGAP